MSLNMLPSLEKDIDKGKGVIENEEPKYFTPTKPCASSNASLEFFPSCEDTLKPKPGMIFGSLQKGIDFYKSYAHLVGFSVRLGSEKKKDGVIHWKHLLCSKEGWYKKNEPSFLDGEMELMLFDNTDCEENKGNGKGKIKRRRSLTRKGCNVICVLKRTLEGKYELLKVQEGHSHALATPSQKHMLKSTRNANPVLKSILRSYHLSNIGDSKAYNLLKVHAGGAENLGCMRRDLQNFHRDIRLLLKNSYAHMFINNFSRMKEKNPSFYYAYEMDEEDKLKHVFWTDGICRKNYRLFGDAISFYTTYGTNKYSMIFAPFTGVNHHRQSVSFRDTLLANEQVKSFVWLFEKFLEPMGGQKPTCIITDQDPSMKAAIKKVFYSFVHRFCVWHIMRKVSEKVGGFLNREDKFHGRLKACVWGSETAEEFESEWQSIISDYELDKSKNSMFDNFVNKQLSLVEFWMRFDFAIQIQRDNEKVLDYASSSSYPQLKTDSELEKQARELYTHMNFYIFQDELWQSCMHCSVSQVHEIHGLMTSVVVDINKGSRKPRREVVYNSSTHEVNCSCKLFHLEGISCRHILTVLKAECLTEIPSSLIVDQWKKNANRKSVLADGVVSEGCVKEKVKTQLCTITY